MVSPDSTVVVSFLIVAFNESRTVARVKEAIDRLQRPENIDVETILIDGGSKDGTVDVARQAGYSRILERPGENIPTCRNAGLREARGQWIAFVDGDCLLDPHWLEHAARLLRAHSPLILGWPAAPPVPGTWVQRAWHAHWMNKTPPLVEDHGETVLKHQGFRMITTRNMIFHRRIADQIGGFDENLSTGEDTDFVFRATMAGIPAWGLPALASVHLGEPATLRAFFKQQVWHANRKAYKTILEKSGMKTGGNAPLFSALFLASLILFLLAFFLLWLLPITTIGLLPLPLLLAALATRTAIRAKTPHLIPALMILYGAYGLARSIDLIGLSPRKPSWKTQKRGSEFGVQGS
ncbi:MAG TPA: glycosyltransferase [Kiritimatiellia bacterium]|mgnify:CR=1 FL=1|nr:glycosyltransferase [Kiritimatiellia bacterium]